MKVLDHGHVKLVDVQGHVGLKTVNAARLSFGGKSEDFSDRDAKLCKYLMDNEHTSPYRHVYFTFDVKAPLFVFRQWWKYQVGSTHREYEMDGEPCAFDIMMDEDKGCSWNELSGRYSVLETEVYQPEVWRANTGRQAANAPMDNDDSEYESEKYASTMGWLLDNYHAALDRGVAKELARLYLPPGIYSQAVWTVSLQSVLHFLHQRLKPEAQLEIRMYAQAVLTLLKPQLSAMGITQ